MNVPTKSSLKDYILYATATLGLISLTFGFTRSCYIDEVSWLEKKVEIFQDSIESMGSDLDLIGRPRLIMQDTVRSERDTITMLGGYVGWTPYARQYGGPLFSSNDPNEHFHLQVIYFNWVDSTQEQALSFHSGDQYPFQVSGIEYRLSVEIVTQNKSRRPETALSVDEVFAIIKVYEIREVE